MTDDTLNIVLTAITSVGGLKIIEQIWKGINKWRSGKADEERVTRARALQRRRDFQTLNTELDDALGSLALHRELLREHAPHVKLPDMPAPREYDADGNPQ